MRPITDKDCGHPGAIVYCPAFGCYVCGDCYKSVVQPLTSPEAKKAELIARRKKEDK